MPKAKPVSLWPLSFDEALKKLISAPPQQKPQKKRSKLAKSHK